MSGAKSDPGDAEVIAEYLRLRRAPAAGPAALQRPDPSAASRGREPATTSSASASPPTTSSKRCLDAFWPGAKAIFADVTQRDRSRRSWSATPHPPPPDSLGDKRHRPRSSSSTATPGDAPAAELARTAPRRARRHRRRPRAEARRDAVARLRAGAPRAQRLHQAARPLHRRPPRRAPGQRDLHLSATIRSDQRSPDARRVGRLPRSLRQPRSRLRSRRARPGHQEAPASTKPSTSAGPATPASATRDDHLRRQLPPRQPLGRRHLPAAPSPAATTTPTPCASSPAPGSASSTAAGSTTTPYDPAHHGGAPHARSAPQAA